jgi:hypothetical protein
MVLLRGSNTAKMRACAHLAAQAIDRGANGGGVVGKVVVDRDGLRACAHMATHLHAAAHILKMMTKRGRRQRPARPHDRLR